MTKPSPSLAHFHSTLHLKPPPATTTNTSAMRYTTLLTLFFSATALTAPAPAPRVPEAVSDLANSLNITAPEDILNTATTADALSEDDHLLLARSHGEQWSKKKITLWTYGHESFACNGHKPQSKHHLQPFKCKSFGVFDRFDEVMFKLPKEVHEEGVQCELTFFDGPNCEGYQTGSEFDFFSFSCFE